MCKCKYVSDAELTPNSGSISLLQPRDALIDERLCGSLRRLILILFRQNSFISKKVYNRMFPSFPLIEPPHKFRAHVGMLKVEPPSDLPHLDYHPHPSKRARNFSSSSHAPSS